jgi:hypothetical protein
MLKDRHFPLVEKSEIVAATYDIPNLGPWDMNFKGMPKFGKIAGVAFLGALYVVIIYGAAQWGVIEGFLLDRAIALAVVFGFGVIGCVMWIFISLNWGTFSRYKRVIDYVWRYLDGRGVRKGEFRVKKITQIWPVAEARLDRQAKILESELYAERLTTKLQLIALPNVGPAVEKQLISIGLDSIVKVAQAKPEKIARIKGLTLDSADVMIMTARDLIIDSLELAQEKLDDATDEELEKEAAKAIEDVTEIEKLSSTYRLDRMIGKIRGIKKAPEMRDAIKEAISLKLEFIRIVRSLDSKFTYSVMECAGDLFVLVISRFSLTGGDDEEKQGGFVEFRDHALVQRTYVYQGTNERGTWGVFTHLADYKYIEVPQRKYLLAGKEEKVKFAPIAFLNYSDGQAELDDEQIREKRFTPEGTDVLQAELVYGASVAEKCLETIKLLTATVSRLKETIKSIWREAMDWAKGVIAKAVEKILLEEKLRKEAGLRSWITNLFSNQAVRLFVYLLGAFGLYMLIGFVVGQLFPQIQLWPWGGIDGGNGGGSSPDPYNP